MEKDIVIKYNTSGPRYTSYPPANFFTTDYNEKSYIENLVQSNNEHPQDISLYVHIPFCPRLCYFCGCNTGEGKDQEFIKRYIAAMVKEIGMAAQYLDTKNRRVTQIHWGGGTPNSISMNLIKQVMDAFHENFTFASNAEVAMECSPAYLEFEDIDFLASLGFNRISLGIQDFDPAVLNSVNREPAKHPVDKLFARMRSHGFKGLNLDLIYGLPNQTMEGFRNSIQKAIEVSPDRLVTFSYAHIPWFNKAQERFKFMKMPTPTEKLDMFQMAFDLLTSNGYDAIGMDHYAKPTDELSIAIREGKLHRNFQGYCTRETTGQVYGFGTSSIGQMWSAYAQNTKNNNTYIDAIESGHFAVERGYALSVTEKIRREVINAVMCNGVVNFEQLAHDFKTDVAAIKDTVAYDEAKLKPFLDDQLITVSGNQIGVTKLGMMAVRNIAMAFDPMVPAAKEGMYSKTI